MPIVHLIKGKETVQSVLKEIENDVFARLKPFLTQAGFEDFPQEIILAAFKEEQTLQVFAKDQNGFRFVKEYPFMGYSGALGPKLKEGDKQIPEGIYTIEYLNPNSSYYLSMKVNYPNAFDKSKSQFANMGDMGGDIFIHGKSFTVGCIPIGDEAIEEIFVMTKKAFANGVKVIISPRDFRSNKQYPTIEAIDWEEELYSAINNELRVLPNEKPL
jgi:murein L,D-transpeptidase YafK